MTGRTLCLALIALMCIAMPLLAGCTQTPPAPTTPTPAVTTPASGMANPAAVYCTQQPNAQYEIRTNPDGSQYGVCILPDGTRCEEWAYYRHECPAPVTTATAGTGIANPSATFCVNNGYNYTIVTNPDGSQAGNCVFPSGKVCDGWAYYRGECNETTMR